MELVQCSDGTVPPHDDTGWWFEPFQDASGRWRCGAKKDHSNTPCLKMSRADHPGRRCKSHAGRPPIHGERSKYGPESRLLSRIQAAKADPQLRNIDERLAILKATLDMALENLDERTSLCEECGAMPFDNLETVKTIAGIVEKYATVVARHEQVANGLKVRLVKDGQSELATRFGRVLAQHQGEKLTPDLVREIVGQLRGVA